MSAGDLNFVITTKVNEYLEDHSDESGPHYDEYNEVIGVLECVKMELYRRQIAPYEQKKMLENGDVY